MKVIIAGGRNYRVTERDVQWLDDLHAKHKFTTVVSGCARGADTAGEEWAAARGIPVQRFPADWDLHGKAAGHIRNRQMAEYADALVAFPGGAGTANMTWQAQKFALRIFGRLI